MLYELVSFSDQIGVLNVFKYITFRTGGAIFTALLFVMLFGPGIIDLLRVKQGKGQPIRDDGPKSHLSKVGTPTMGGLMILAGVTVSTLLWANLGNPYIWIVLGVTLGYGAIGFYDDYLKVKRRTSSGFSSRMRLGLEILIAAVATGFVMYLGPPEISKVLTLPFFKNVVIDLGLFFVVVGVFTIAGAGNAVNLTDGLDGLAIVPVMIAAATFGLIAYLIGNAKFAQYLQVHYVAGTGELAIICGALIGAGLGFLWFNAPPAMIFMGDTGSLALGAPSAPSPSLPSTRSCSPSSADCSYSRRSPSSSRWPPTRRPENACSAWRRYTTITSSRGGRNRPSWCAFGSFP